MANGPYSAGTAFLTVVPSFLGIEDAFKKQVRAMAQSADKDIAAGMAKGLDEANRQAKDKGARGGRDYAGAYGDEAKKALDKAWRSLPEPQPDVDLRKWDKALASIRSEMKDLSSQRIGIDIDRATFDRALDDFRKRLEALRDSATGQNKEIGFFNADSAAKEIAEFQRFADDISRRAGDAGEQSGSAFNQKFSQSLRNAMSKIPTMKIDADSSEAEQKLAEVQARMQTLADKRIGINIDAADAYAEMRTIKADLDSLDRRSVRVDIRTNAHEASAQMSAFVQQAEQAGQATQRIGSSANFSLSRLEYLIALGVSLGTSIVPAAAAAAGAIGLIGTAAVSALAGVGVFALGISGVADAVKALNQYQNDQAKSAKSVNDANRSLASSTDQVRTAQASLANTRRTVGQAAEDAARQVTDAEQGVADARRQAAKEVVNAQREVADARKGVADAERDLGDARRQSAIDIADANRQVRDAQEAVTDAERDATDVRKSLNDAIKEATLNMEELDVKLSRNAVDQQKAVTAQMKALEELNKLKTNPRATQVELRQAQDAYDEQTQRIKELQQDNKELAADKQKYDKQGVEGDQQVIAVRKRIAEADKAVATARERLAREEQQRQQTQYRANERISDAQDRVAKAQQQVARAQEAQRDSEIRGQERVAAAQRQVADARRQQARQALDGQYQLAQASQAVTAAQRSQQAAWEKTGTAGGDALDTLNEKMGDLSPAAQHFAKFLFGLKDQMIELRAAAAEPLLPRLEDAINLLLPALPAVEKFVGKVAGALGDLAVEAVQSLGNPVWQRFFHFVDENAVPGLQLLYDVGQNVAQGLINLFLALTPFNKQAGSGLVDLSRDFAMWAERLDKSQGYQDFLEYVKTNGPRVVHFLGEVGELLINLVKAAAPIGAVVLKGLTLVVDVLNSIPTGALTALIAGIGLVSAGLLGIGAVMRVIKFKEQLTEIFGPKVSGMVQTYAVETGRATDATSRFGKATATVAGLANASRDKVAGYASAVASVPGRLSAAASGNSVLGRSMDAVRVASLNAAAAVNGPGGVAGAVQNAGQRVTGFAAAAEVAARSGLEKFRAAIMDVAVAANGPGGIAAGISVAGGKLGGFARTADRAAETITKKLTAGAGGLVSMLGGPWAVALEAATVAVGYFAAKSAEQRAKVDTLKSALGELSSTYQDLSVNGQQAGQAADDAFRNIVKNNPDMQQAVITLDQMGISFDQMVAAATSGDPSSVVKKLNDEIGRQNKLVDEWEHNQRLYASAGENNPYFQRKKQLEAIRDAYVENSKALGQATQADQILSDSMQRHAAVTAFTTNNVLTSTDAQRNLLQTYDDNAQQITILTGLVNAFGNVESTAADRATAMRKAIEGQTSAAVDSSEASEALAQKTQALRDQVNQAKSAHDKNSTSLSLNSSTALRNRDALEEVAKQIREMYLQDIAAGRPMDDVTKRHNNRITALKEEAKRLGLDKTATQQLIDTYGDVPKNVTTKVGLDPNSFQSVYKNLQRMQFMQSMLKIGMSPDKAEAEWNDYQREVGRALSRAEGGPIAGPGTATSDSIPAWLSNGEWVHQAAAVNYYGDSAMAAINNMQVPREQLQPRFATGGKAVPQQRSAPDARSPRYAKGGSATWPMPVDVSKTWVPTEAWVRESAAKLAAAAVDLGSKFTGLSPDASVSKIQKFALAQRGKKYLWAAVGPNRYDCSGLVGNLWALATGHKLYRRYMSTADMGPGRHGMAAGPGKKMTIYLGPGHTAANVGGLHVEAYGGNGTPLAIGRVGTRLSYYNQKLHIPGFAEGGQVDPSKIATKQDRMISFLRYGWPEPPVGEGFDTMLDSPLVANQFDTGGMIPPGYSSVYNGTGRPEPVLTDQQWQDIRSLAHAASAGRGAGNTHVYNFRDTTLTPGYLRGMQDREAVLARDDRAH